MSIQKIKEDILALRGAKVHIFGQPTTLETEVAEDTIDIMDVLDALESHEVTEMYIPVYDEDGEWIEDEEVEDVEQYLDFLEELGELKELSGDNSYNWNSPVSNHFNIYKYESMLTGEYLYEFKVHRYGDVRANYTESTLLAFKYEEEFLETLLECSKSLDINGYEVRIEIISEGIEVYTQDGKYVTTVYDLDDVPVAEEEEI